MSVQEKEEWYNYYKNILLYFKYRGEVVKEELSKEDLIKEMISHNLVNIKSKKIQIILTSPKQKYSGLNNETKKKITEVLNNDKVEELMYICGVTLAKKDNATQLKTIDNLLQDFQHINDKIWVQIRPYTTFINNIPECFEVVKHYRLNQEDVKKELELTHTPVSSLMKIHEWDPPVTWLGARAGEVIGIQRLSGSIGEQTILRRVVL
jgi:DNA-directed RNA polymerase subunit H (RpoH/RPB5)